MFVCFHLTQKEPTMPRQSSRKRRKVNYTIIPRSTRGKPHPDAYIYDLLDDVIGQHRDELAEARILLAWQVRIKADKDDRLMLGKCVKASDLSKELQEHDFVIVLNSEAWASLSDHQRLALLHHESMHAAPAIDQNTGEQQEDERDRKVWRIRKHSIEEFHETVAAYGCYKHDLEAFVRAASRKLQPEPSLFDAPADGTAPVDDSAGVVGDILDGVTAAAGEVQPLQIAPEEAGGEQAEAV
jgi:hypothetical protein